MWGDMRPLSTFGFFFIADSSDSVRAVDSANARLLLWVEHLQLM